uniref:Uncharacterized protein n=1 Tax=Amphimedon queenslandica TaxID=400682 RepID=A0A1X7U7Y2_AMPQE
ERGASSWLTVLPIKEHGFTLHKGDFRDTLCLRYGWSPPLLLSHCVCGHNFLVEHTLNCKCRDYFQYKSANSDNNARVDIAATDFWSSHQRSFLDVRVFNPNSSSYINSTLKTCHRRHEMERRYYKERICNIEHGSFTPFVFFTSGGIGPSANSFYEVLPHFSQINVKYHMLMFAVGSDAVNHSHS